jgi:hypothetical protein
LALPSPECWVMIRPGATSSASAGRDSGRALTSAPLIVFSLAEAGGVGSALNPGVTPAPPAAAVGAAARCATGRFGSVPLRGTRGLAAGRGGASTSTGDSTVVGCAADGVTAASEARAIPADEKRERCIGQSAGLCWVQPEHTDMPSMTKSKIRHTS